MSTAGRKVLFIVTSHDRLGETAERTGIWTEELAAPYYLLIDAGVHVDLASTRGGKAPLDPGSVKVSSTNPASVERFVRDPDAIRLIATTRNVEAVDFVAYDAVFFPGGNGTMWDLPGNAAIADKLGTFFDSGRVVAAVCHGAAGLVSARSKQGRPIVKGRRISAFTDAEELATGLTRVVPFLLESRLRGLGGRFARARNFQPFAVRDRNLITGQNPMSSDLVARHLLEALWSGAAVAA